MNREFIWIILQQTAAQLNGFWISGDKRVTTRLIISKNPLTGQLLYPYESIQQVAPIAVKLVYSKTGNLSLIASNDTIRVSILDDVLTMEKETFKRIKK